LKNRSISLLDHELKGSKIKAFSEVLCANNAEKMLLVINHQTPVFQVKNFHCGKPLVDENKNLSALHVSLHYGSYDPTERIKAFAHIHGRGIKKVLEFSMQMKHSLSIIKVNNRL
jgi:hypothetical protein